jgi:1-acyl-sn-glycerol-3-phosphate acyltransferase
MTPFYRFVCTVSWPVVRVLYRLRVTGIENLPADGGFVLAANHLSNFDPWPLGLSLFPRRQLRFMAKAELFDTALGPLLEAGGTFRVRRGASDIEAMKTAVRLVQDGEIVVMFPHGTRATKGRNKKVEPRAYSGAARIALRGGVPLVPAAIAGTDHLLRLGPLRVNYGTPVPVDDLTGLDRRRAADEATDRLLRAIEQLQAPLDADSAVSRLPGRPVV